MPSAIREYRPPIPNHQPRISVAGRASLLRRWVAFNAVGILGIGVQFGVLAVLVGIVRLHYLAATAVAVELAILNNFMWHQYWTWRDRASAGPATILARLGRFQLLNGTISLAGNLMLMGILTGRLGLDPLVANALAVVTCSLVNFLASETIVFATPKAAAVLIAGVILVGAPTVASAGDPSPATITAWQAYEQRVTDRYQAATDARHDFFAHDQFDLTPGWREVALKGGVAMTQLKPAGAALAVPDAQLHHWVGAVYVPQITLESVLTRLQEAAGRESELYEDVVSSKLLARDGNRLRVYMKLRRDSVITVTYNTEHLVEYWHRTAGLASSRSVATRIAELADAGTPSEREKPAGSDHGFLWRLNAYWRYEQVAGGVLIECESLTLSRNIPTLVRPVVAPIVNRVARESLDRTLRAVRAALSGRVS